MNRKACRASFFDASALVKIYTQEPSSGDIRTYFSRESTKYTTPFCFYESLNILKSKYLYQGKLELKEYVDAVLKLTAWYGASSARIKDLNFTDPHTFLRAKEIVEEHNMDFSDAFQIISVKEGYFSNLILDSQTVFVTADKKLARVAKLNGLRTWSVQEELPPD